MVDKIYFNEIKLLPIKALVFFDDRGDDERIVIYDILSESSWDLNPITKTHSRYSKRTVGYQFNSNIVAAHNLYRKNELLDNLEKVHAEIKEWVAYILLGQSPMPVGNPVLNEMPAINLNSTEAMYLRLENFGMSWTSAQGTDAPQTNINLTCTMKSPVFSTNSARHLFLPNTLQGDTPA
jgi:hypothetical protein